VWFHGVLNGRKLDVGGQRVVLNYECCGGWWKFRQWEICHVRTKTCKTDYWQNYSGTFYISCMPIAFLAYPLLPPSFSLSGHFSFTCPLAWILLEETSKVIPLGCVTVLWQTVSTSLPDDVHTFYCVSFVYLHSGKQVSCCCLFCHHCNGAVSISENIFLLSVI
jgi:hypothetical protein